MPSRSMNLKSTILAPCFSASFRTSAGVMDVPLLRCCVVGLLEAELEFDDVPALEGVLGALAGPDADRFLDRGDEDLSVADAPGAGDRRNRFDDVADDVVLDDDFDADFRDEVDDVRRPAIDLFFATGATEPFDFVDRHTLNADLTQPIFHVVQFERLDDRLDFFHEQLFKLPTLCFASVSRQLNRRNRARSSTKSARRRALRSGTQRADELADVADPVG